MKILLNLLFPLLLVCGNKIVAEAPDNGPGFVAIIYDNTSINLCEDECTETSATSSTIDIVIELIDGVAPYRVQFETNWNPAVPMNTTTFTIRDAQSFHFLRICHNNTQIAAGSQTVGDTTFLTIPSDHFPGELIFQSIEDANFCSGDIISLTNPLGPRPIPLNACPLTTIDYTADVPRNSCDTLFLPEINPSSPTAKYYTERGGLGTEYCPGDTLCYFQTLLPLGMTIDTLYINDGQGNPEVALPFTINRSPFLQIPEDTLSCGPYRLEPFRGPLVTPRAQYASENSFSAGSLLDVGDPIMMDTWIYIADTTENITTGGTCTFLDSFFVDYVDPVNPGMDTIITICSGTPTIISDPFLLLRGAETGGEWSGTMIPDVDFNNPIDIDLSDMPAGVSYQLIYTIESPGCPIDTWSSIITFNAIAPPYAGVDSTLSVCARGDMNFFEYLSFPNPTGQLVQFAGDIVDVSDPSSVNMSSATPGSYAFDYIIPAIGACDAQVSTLNLNITTGVNAGADNSGLYCYQDSIFLSELLSPDAETAGQYFAGGFFPIPDGKWDSGSLIVAPDVDMVVEEILYVVDGSALNCPPDTARFSITLIRETEAGFPLSNSIELCEGEEIGLPQLLEGESDFGDFFLTSDYTTTLDTLWTVPATDQSLAYVVPGVGNGSCPPDTALLNISVIPQANVSFVLSENSICDGDGCVTGTFMTNRPIAVDMLIEDAAGNQFEFTKDRFDNDIYVFCPGGTLGETSADTIFIGSSEGYSFSIADVEDTQTGCNDATVSSLTELTVGTSYEVTFTGTVCLGSTTEVNGVEYGASTTLPFITAEGCDSIINIVIDTLPQITGNFTRSFCRDMGPQTILGMSFSNDTMGLFTFSGEAAGGCDSLVMLDISFTDVASGVLDTFACVGGNVMIDGEVIDTEGMTEVKFAGQSAAGCDSTTLVNFSFSSSVTGILDTIICEGMSFTKGLDTYDENMMTGTSLLQGAGQNGCDSLLEVTVQFSAAASFTLDTMICAGDFFIKGTTIYDENNLTGMSLLSGSGGCDSILTVQVSLSDQVELILTPTICAGETIELYGNTYGQGVLTDEVMVPALGGGCDTIAKITVTEIIATTEQRTDEICADGFLIFNGVTYDADMLTGTETILSSQGCDSLILKIALTVANTSASIANEIFCEGEAMGTFDITELSGLSFPLEVYVEGQLVETINAVPATISAMAGLNTVTLDDGNCRFDTNVNLMQLTASSSDIVVTDLGMNDYSLTYNSNFTPTALNWDPEGILDCDDCEVVMATVIEETIVTLQLTTPEGCEIFVNTLLPYEELVPDSTTMIYKSNMFRPLDSQNGVFYVQSNLGTIIDRLSIYDRWGNLVFLNENFLSNDPAEGWNGFHRNELAEQGVYVYHLEYRDETGRLETISNSLTLIR